MRGTSGQLDIITLDRDVKINRRTTIIRKVRVKMMVWLKIHIHDDVDSYTIENHNTRGVPIRQSVLNSDIFSKTNNN